MATAVTRFFPYQRLKQEDVADDEYERENVVVRSRNWFRFTKARTRRRLRLKVPSLRKLLKRKVGLVAAKVMKRLKESQAHFGDLFAGNYLVMQINPTPLKYLKNSCYQGNNNNPLNNFLSSRYSQQIAQY